MRLYDRNGREISDWRDWTRPKKDYQWKAGRSAMELARSWFTAPQPVLPPEIRKLLNSHPETREAELAKGWPELVTTLPFPGEGRNHDLVAVGSSGSRRLLLAVECKVDEPLGELIGDYWRKSKRTAKSNAWKRIDTLLDSAFGPSALAIGNPWSELRYQLLTALVGTALEAEKQECEFAVLCIQEFVTQSADPERIKANGDDLSQFVRALGVRPPKDGVLSGPFPVKSPVSGAIIPVLVGKTQYRWTDR